MTEIKDILNEKSGEIFQNIKDIFKEEAKAKQVTIQIKLHQSELCELNFNLDSLQNVNKDINKIVAATVEQVLNQIPRIQTVQNKL